MWFFALKISPFHVVFCFENLLKHLRHDNSHEANMNSFLLSKSKLSLLVINIYFLIVIINSFNMNSLRQYTQSDEVFPIQNLLEKIGMSGGEKKKKPVATNSIFMARLTDATTFGWDGTIPRILEAL